MIQARFKSIDVIDGAATLRWTPGIQPSSTCVRLSRAPRAGEEGGFVLSDGFGNRISVAMVVESVEEVSSVGGGRAWDVVLKDARAFWKFGAITGRYNQPDATGKPARERTLRQLAEFCLDALPRVRSHSTAALPMDEFPAVEWLWENPADALEALLGERFTVVFGFDGSVEIRRANEGRDYESVSPYLSRSLKTRREKEYDGVVIVGERTIRQVNRVLMPVGLDVDGKWKALKDLSYAPDKAKEDGGFGREFARDGFASLRMTFAPGADGRKIANELIPLIFRAYGGIPGDELPLLNELCDREFDENGRERYKAPFAVGPLVKRQTVNGVTVTDVVDGLLDGYTIDHQRGLLIFQEAQIQPTPDEQSSQMRTDALPAHLYLMYAFEAKASQDSDIYRYGDVEADAPLVIHAPQLRLREKWPRTVYPLVSVPPDYQREYDWLPLNKADLDEYAGQVYRAYASTSEEITGGSITLIGLKDDLAMDGLFRSATFTVGPRGSTTEIEWGVETPKAEMPTYRERMRARLADKAATALSGAASGAVAQTAGNISGAVGREFHDPAKPALFAQRIPDVVLARNTTGEPLPCGCPVGPDAQNPIGADGIWNITFPADVNGFVFGVAATDIQPGGVGYITSPVVGNVMIDVTSAPTAQMWSRLKPAIGSFAWVEELSAPACVIVVKIFGGARRPALATIMPNMIF